MATFLHPDHTFCAGAYQGMELEGSFWFPLPTCVRDDAATGLWDFAALLVCVYMWQHMMLCG
eukprot:m.121490 g.121490  ORF g.121490 m.121490 type:complete len:62 (-) comp15523_c0_seq1:440-625(-)